MTKEIDILKFLGIKIDNGKVVKDNMLDRKQKA